VEHPGVRWMKGYAKLGAVIVIVVLLLSSILFVNADESMNESVECEVWSVEGEEQGSGVRGQGSGCRDGNENVFDDFTQGTLNGTHIDENNDLTLGWQPPIIPYTKDENTTLLCHFDESLDGVDGEEPLEIIDSTCVGYWKFDEGTGTITKDSSSYGNDGTLVDYIPGNSDGNTPPQWIVGKFDSSLEFDGVDDFVEIPYDVSLELKSVITIEGWVKTNILDDGGQVIIHALASGGGNNAVGCGFNVTRFFFVLKLNETEQVLQINNVMTIDTWYFITCTFDGSKMRIYINGKIMGTKPISGIINHTKNPWVIGSDRDGGGHDEYLNGLIDEITLYNRSKTAEEINASYLDMKSKFTGTVFKNGKFNEGVNIDKNDKLAYPNDISIDTSCVGYWKFDEGNGTTAYDSIGKANPGKWYGWSTGNWTNSKLGTALEFDGINDCVEILSNSEIINFGKNDFTIEFWLRVPIGYTHVKNVRVFSIRSDTTGGAIRNEVIFTPDGKIGINPRDADTDSLGMVGVTDLRDNQWHFFATVRESNVFKIYVDDKLENQTSRPSIDSIANSGDIQIGRCIYQGGDDYFQGAIDNIAIFNRFKTTKEITNDYLNVDNLN
jgi:hypothetical protein